MSGYGHDESVPYASRSVRNQFRGCSTHYYNICNTSSQTVHNSFREYSMHHTKPSATRLFRDGYAF